MIPSRKECYLLLKKYRFPDRKLRHVELVAEVSRFLAEKLNSVILRARERSERVEKLKVERSRLSASRRIARTISLPLLEAAALLHDIDKGIPGAGETHPKEGVAILRREGYEELADLVAKHSLPAILDDEIKPKTWEEKILFLADKMAKDQVMTVDQRFQLWRDEHISELDKVLDKTYAKVKMLEKEIFTIVGIRPDEVARKLQFPFTL